MDGTCQEKISRLERQDLRVYEFLMIEIGSKCTFDGHVTEYMLFCKYRLVKYLDTLKIIEKNFNTQLYRLEQ